jgi:hypothetical protein
MARLWQKFLRPSRTLIPQAKITKIMKKIGIAITRVLIVGRFFIKIPFGVLKLCIVTEIPKFSWKKRHRRVSEGISINTGMAFSTPAGQDYLTYLCSSAYF